MYHRPDLILTRKQILSNKTKTKALRAVGNVVRYKGHLCCFFFRLIDYCIAIGRDNTIHTRLEFIGSSNTCAPGLCKKVLVDFSMQFDLHDCQSPPHDSASVNTGHYSCASNHKPNRRGGQQRGLSKECRMATESIGGRHQKRSVRDQRIRRRHHHRLLSCPVRRIPVPCCHVPSVLPSLAPAEDDGHLWRVPHRACCLSN